MDKNKNVWLLPTDKPIQNIYITSNEEIKEGDWFMIFTNKKPIAPTKAGLFDSDCKKIILTTDQDLINDGVQAIDDEFLQWFVKNPSCEYVEVGYGWIRLAETDNEGYWVSIPDKQFEMQQEEPKQETLEEASSRLLYSKYPFHPPQDSGYWKDMFLEGAKWQAERMYSKEEANEIIAEAWNSCEDNEGETFTEVRKRILEQFKKK
jgi:hypothetical protein